MPGEARRLVEAANQYLKHCLAHESPPRVSEFAREAAKSRNWPARIFQRFLGSTASAYFKRRQLEAAKHLLSTTDLSAQKIGYMTGFGTRRTFFRAFHKNLGITPIQFRGRAKCL